MPVCSKSENIEFIPNTEFLKSPRSIIGRLRFKLLHRRGQNQFERARRIDSKPLESAFPGIANTRVSMIAPVHTAGLGNVSFYELCVLSTVCAYIKPHLLFEFGTFDGLTTLHLAMNCAQDARIITLDLDPDDVIRNVATDDTFYTRGKALGEWFRGTDEETKIEQILCNSREYDHSALRRHVDFIFVDAGHTYELVASDTQKALEMVRPGGVIFWHDYSYMHCGVYAFLNEVAASVPMIQIERTALVCHVVRT